ncbi:MAG: SDR family oxidoreductase [Chloroflexi bacterium]|nr:SDR family oxidoreductase [Chloroflexota bacterium]
MTVNDVKPANQNGGLHVIFGTGPLGTSVMRQLVNKGRRVRVVNRSGKAETPAGVEVVRGDATDPASACEVCRGAGVVYNCANPPYTEWVTLFPRIQAGILEGAAAAGAKLISAENVYMYGEVDRPMAEDMPYNAHTRKGQVRARMAQALLEAHRSGKVRAAIGRASDFYGPGVLGSAAGERVFYPALQGKQVLLLGKLDVPHTYTYIDDFGRGLVTLGECEEALEQAWHIPSAETLTTRQFLMLVFEATGQPPKMAATPNVVVKALGLFDPMMRELVEMLYEFDRPFIVDHSKYERAFGNHSTPHREAIRRTVDWFRARSQK